MPTYKPVGVDENSLFPPRVQQKIEETISGQLENYPQVLADPTAVAAYAAGLTPGTAYTVIQANPFDVLQGVA